MTNTILISIIIICLTSLSIASMYFTYKEKIAKLNAENNPLSKLFSGDKNKKEN